MASIRRTRFVVLFLIIFIPTQITSESPECIVECESKRLAKMRKAITGLNFRQIFPIDALLFLISNNGLLKFYCDSHQEYRNCIEPCQNSPYKRMAEKMDTFNVIACKNSGQNVVSPFSCMKSMSPATLCLEGCAPYHAYSYELLNNFFNWMMHDWKLQVQTRVPIACRYMLCAFDCELNSIRRECGLKTYQFMQNLLVHAFSRSLRESLAENGLSWPPICEIFEHRINTEFVIDKLKKKLNSV